MRDYKLGRGTKLIPFPTLHLQGRGETFEIIATFFHLSFKFKKKNCDNKGPSSKGALAAEIQKRNGHRRVDISSAPVRSQLPNLKTASVSTIQVLSLTTRHAPP